MKRTITLVLAVMVLFCGLLTGCQSSVINCPQCGADSREGASFCEVCGESLPKPTESEEYCKKCGQLLPSVSIDEVPQSDSDKIQIARKMMIENWQGIAAQDEVNDGYFEIKNTRIIWLDDEPIEFFGEYYYVDCIVEFNIYTDHYGAAPYYFETEYQNDVIFYTDGTIEINEDIADWVWDPEELAGRFTVVDYGGIYNQAIDLFTYIPEIHISAEWDDPVDEGPVDEGPVDEAPVEEAPQELLPKDDPNYSLLDMGACNGNVYWEIRSNGVLYIYGMGAIPNYEAREVDGAIAPWRASSVSSQITDVVIADGITGTGERNFENMYLSSIYFADTVVAYGYGGPNSYLVETAYIPASMQDVDNFLYGADSNWGPVTITIYYEGTEEQWQSVMGYQGYNDNTYVMHYNYNY